MIVDWILVVAGLIGVIIATGFDIFTKTREIPDFLNYGLIAIGLGVRAVYSIFTLDYLFFVYGLIGFGAFFIIANLMYYTKQWGGGDCKLLMGLGAIFGSYLNIGIFNAVVDVPFLAILFINILLAGAIYGIVYSLVLGIVNYKGVKKNTTQFDLLHMGLGLFAGIAIILISAFAFVTTMLLVLGVLIGVFILLGVFLVRFMKIIEKCCLHKWKSVKELVEGDWLVEDVKVGNKIIIKAKGLGLDKKDLTNLIKFKIKKVHVKEGLPFIPAFLIGLVISLIWGNILYLFI